LIVDLVLSNAKAYVDGKLVDCSLSVDDGKIVKIGKEATMPKADTALDLRNLVVLPGLIDAHVHLRDEGKAREEDFYTGTAAAAVGGMTTVLDMPNNDPITMNVETLRNRMRIAENKILVNVGFFSEFPEDTEEIKKIVHEGAIAFKLFMAEQVGGLNIDDDSALLKGFKIVSSMKTLVAAHAEDRATIREAEERLKRTKRSDVDAFLDAHNESAEVKAIKRLVNITKRAGSRLHFCHVSTKEGSRAIIDGKKSQVPVSCEVTPHHLFLSANELRTIGKTAITMPPIREEPHQAALWDGIRNGWIDIVASDHAPHTLEEKQAKNIWDVKVGIAGLETILPLLLTAVNHGRLSLADLVRLMAEKPSEIFRLEGKGRVEEGNGADLTIVDLKSKYKIDAAKFHSKAKFSPFDGWVVEGKPVKTFVGGRLIMDEGEIVAEAGSGQIIRRE